MSNDAVAEHAEKLAEDLNPIETRSVLAEALGITLMTTYRREKLMDIEPVAHLKACVAFDTQDYLKKSLTCRVEKT